MTAATAIAGVTWGRITRHGDSRGSFREVWRDSAFPQLTRELTGGEDARFVQSNVSSSAAGVLRGLHYHRRQLDHWVVLDGHAFVALVDIRPTADGGRPIVETRELRGDETVTIPAGVAHGFLALSDLTLMYLVTNEYDGSDELGFRWDDPWAAVPWPRVAATPDGNPILSERDQRNPPLKTLLETLRHI
jgi:dTDP-4-dehydrorhamnose 3,5-epimerase